jgi:hypothetical protein
MKFHPTLIFLGLVVFSFLILCVTDKVSPLVISEQQRARIAQLIQKYQPFLIGHQNEVDVLLHQWADSTPCTRHQLCDFANDLFCANVCKIGSVQIVPTLANVLSFQQKLQRNLPLNYVVFPSTHNSAIAKAYGYGLWEDAITEWLNNVSSSFKTRVYVANQQFSLTDQFRMGIRAFELDTHWYDNNLVICHAGGIHIKLLNDLIKEISNILGITIEWDSETIGCIGRTNRPLNKTFAEIVKWFTLRENSKEFAIFMFDDQDDLQQWGKVHFLVDGIQFYFGKRTFTPVDKQRFFPTRWPSISELTTMGKNVMFVSTTDFGTEMNTTIFARNDVWNETNAKDPWKPFPLCTSGPLFSQKGKITRLITDSLIFGPFYNGPETTGVLGPDQLRAMTECGFNILAADQISPKLLESAVWTWDLNKLPEYRYPCTVMESNGFWGSADCNEKLPFACQSLHNPLRWTINTTYTATFHENSNCADGFQFGLPSNPYWGQFLNQTIQENKVSRVWINIFINTTFIKEL